jgi:hypothetical protein
VAACSDSSGIKELGNRVGSLSAEVRAAAAMLAQPKHRGVAGFWHACQASWLLLACHIGQGPYAHASLHLFNSTFSVCSTEQQGHWVFKPGGPAVRP